MKKQFFPVGKLPQGLLERLLQKYVTIDKQVLVGPSIGEDATVIEFGDKYLVAKTDPITLVGKDCGWYAVNVNANDIAAMGAVPRWFLATILLPEGKSTEEYVEEIFENISSACREFEISFCGGHTEITAGLNRTIIVGQMLGEVPKDKLVLSSGAKKGDDVLLTKGIAIEGTSVIAREKESYLKKKYSPAAIERMKKFAKVPGISVLKEALLANTLPGIHAMHDPTEGGLSMGLYELAKASKAGLEIEEDKIFIFPESLKLCNEFKLNPLGLIASGSLIIVTTPGITDKVRKLLGDNRINVSVIGRVVKEPGVKLVKKGKKGTEIKKWDCPYFEQDEITKISAECG
jgi:hydrogenase maturation factor